MPRPLLRNAPLAPTKKVSYSLRAIIQKATIWPSPPPPFQVVCVAFKSFNKPFFKAYFLAVASRFMLRNHNREYWCQLCLVMKREKIKGHLLMPNPFPLSIICRPSKPSLRDLHNEGEVKKKRPSLYKGHR